MESAKEFAERYFVESSGAHESLAKDIAIRDAALLRKAGERAVVWVDNHAQPLCGGSFSREEYDYLRAKVGGVAS